MTTAAKQDSEIRPSANGRRPSEEDRENFCRLAEAFATLFELSDYLPGRTAQQLGDLYMEITLNGDVRLSAPDVIRAVFPVLAELGGLDFTDEEGGDEDESQS